MDHFLDAVRRRRMSRRQFVRVLGMLGVAAPLAHQALLAAGLAPAHAQSAAAWTPTKRGGGGPLRMLWWQAATLLNPQLTTGLKDADGARLFYEPLVGFDGDGTVVPVLAAEVPSVENGTVARDGLSVVWRLKRNVVWHDGKPFTADDVVFNWEYGADPATAASSLGTWERVERVERVDSHTARVVFKKPTPFWAQFGSGMLIPRHVFQPFRGQKSREAPANLRPVGTGPYRIVDFRPGDLIRAELHPGYHLPNRPFFDTVEIKGGGDAVSAARAVLQTGEYDYAWNLQVEDDVLKRLERSGKGRVDTTFGGTIEHLLVNQTDPWREVDGERSSPQSAHPFLTDPGVRAALRVLVDRAAVQGEIYGRAAVATGAYINAPARFRSAAPWEFSVEKANQALDAAGWKRGADGIRARDGVKLKVVFQTAINAPRQKTQAIIKRAAAQAGIEMELKSVAASAYFSSDPANADTASHFNADLQMYALFMGAPDPEGLMRQFTSAEVASKANKWQRRNVTRYRNAEYDKLFAAAEVELDPAKRAALFIRMNDLLVQQAIVVPIVARGQVAAVSNRLKDIGRSGWQSDVWRLAYWHT
ncbi:MAG TPA: peptide ABC transporter substrate-binding protein [Terriglobales bacterium]|nr:peptide ABC transporter substrate-binding protein [Terriglobales bacterium]